MDSILIVLEPLFNLVILDGLFDHLNNTEIQLLATIAAGLAGASRHHGESPQQLFRSDVWLSKPFIFRNTFQRGKPGGGRTTQVGGLKGSTL